MKRHIAPIFLRALCGMVAMLVFMTGIASIPVLAVSNGIYIATATPHYKHPTTGVIEDSGGDGSAALGQSMTESATYKKALVEVDAKGNTYVTIRLQLMDNIQNVSFSVDGASVGYDIMQENYGSLSKDNTADFRMKVNSENSILRCQMYVIAMGRDVIFYITVSNLQEGSGDFVTSVKVETPTDTEEPSVTETPATTKNSDTTEEPAAAETPTETEDPAEETPEEATQSSAVDVTDEATGIKAEAEKGVLEEGATFVVAETESGDAYNKAAELLGELGEKFKLYDIYFESNGAEIQPDGSVKVSYPIPEGYDEENLALYRINDDGTTALMEGTVEGDCYVVTHTSFSTYALVELAKTHGTSEETEGLEMYDENGNLITDTQADMDDEDKVDGGVLFFIIGGVAAAVAAGVGIWYFVFFKRKKS